MTNAQRNWFDSSAVNGQQYGYAYDNIGNRQTSSTGVSPVNYTVNSLNQYTDILTPGLKDILGAALATNSVSVNGGLADRKGEYFHSQISVANTNQPVWQMVTNISGTFTNKGGLAFPANNQALVYDADGNLTFDGIWTYQWDGENRLISMTMTNVSGIANANRLRLDFAYDFMGRRISKIVSIWNSSTLNFQPSTTNYFVYDGWNLLAILNPQSSILASFAWGNDLSGTMTGAGGVGGLLMANLSGTNCFAAYDGNGNITALINAADESLAARYEYSPYGELIRATGLLATQNPFRFSTRFWDDESGLVYYDSRFYSPALGRWINRDPTIDQVYLNLCLFCQNNPIIRFDRNGCDTQLELDFSESIGAEIDGNANAAVSAAFKSALTGILKGGLLGGFENGELTYLKGKNWDDVAHAAASGMLEGGIEGGIGSLGSGLGFGKAMVAKLAANAGIEAAFQRAEEGKFDFTKLVIGVAIGAACNEDDNLDAALQFAGTVGADAAEDIWGIAEQTTDALQ